MANRTRTNRNEFHLNDKEQYILDEKFKLSGMKSKSAFIRKLILYGYVYDVDYSFLREYNTELGRISSNLNQIAKRINSTNHIYQEDMDEVKELMNEVWRTQKSMLSKQPLPIIEKEFALSLDNDTQNQLAQALLSPGCTAKP